MDDTVGLAAELGYHHHAPNRVQRAFQAFGSTWFGARLFSKILPPLDRAVSRLTDGRTTLPPKLAGLPVLELTTTGRRSGLPRHTHLIAIPIWDTLALLGTNFGQQRTPTWVLNLEADPRATVHHDGVSAAVVARPATEEEFAEVLATSTRYYGGYARYQQRITGRRLRIFVLEHGGS